MKNVAMVLLLGGLALAGCTSDPEPDVDDPDQVLEDPDEYYAQHHCVRNDVRPRVLAPDAAGTPWQVGQWWAFSLATDDRPETDLRLVYFGDQDFASDGTPAHYMVGTRSYEPALEHALWSTNPAVGRIHRLLYSPHEAGAHADMFNFPLCEDNTWTTTFYERTFQMTAHQATVDLPDGEDPDGFRIDGEAPDGSTVTYTFSPETGWFTDIRLDRADGRTVDIALTGYGTGESGTFYFLRGQQDQVIDVADLADGPIEVERAPGDEGDYDRLGIYLELTRESGDGRVELILEDPAGDRAACVGIAGSGIGGGTDCDGGPLQTDVGWQEGSWTVRLRTQALSPAEAGGEVRLVSIYDRSGST